MNYLDIGIDYGELSALILTIGGCLALIGAVVIYKKWSMGNHNIDNEVLMWAGGIVMLIIIQVFIKVMFGM
jgi:hypothetical protein